MDPLSVTASIVGILAATGKIGEILNVTISSAKDAPRVLTALACEVREVQAVLPSLQVLLTNLSSAQPHRAAMIQLDQLIVTLTEAALTLHELEQAIAPFIVLPGSKTPVRVKLRWTRAEGNCTKFVERLQRHKASMSLMLNILQCTSDAEASRSQLSLETMVAELLQANQQLCKRLQNLEDSFDARSTITKKFDNLSLHSEADNATITSAQPAATNRMSIREAVRIRFAFDDDLQSSRVYRMVKRDGYSHSLISSAIRTQTWSIFSGLSLADISVISVVALPLYPEDVECHAQYYHFGELEPSQSETTATWTDNQNLIDTQHLPLLPTSSIAPSSDQRPLSEVEVDTISSSTSRDFSTRIADVRFTTDVQSEIPGVQTDTLEQLESPMFRCPAVPVADLDTAEEHAQDYPDFDDSEYDGILYPCKGCGEILEEGKAYELAGNRWHIDCFRCTTCGILLDSDSKLLLSSDGALICSDCTYSCSHCGQGIEDMAILTGDDAYCANCFTCRYCKQKIENLRYAMTSRGIFCMNCHDSLMAR